MGTLIKRWGSRNGLRLKNEMHAIRFSCEKAPEWEG
jgi:hypothetical protein